MEALFVLLAILLVIGIPVSVIVLLVWVSGLARRLRAVEAQLRHIGTQGAPAKANPPAPPAPTAAEVLGPERPEVEATDAAEEPVPVAARTRAPATTTTTSTAVRRAGRRGPTPFVPPAPTGAARPRRDGPSLVDRGLAWLQGNWFYVAAAAALTLAGIFLVQYGAERGLLPPRVRVIAALVFGLALIAGGEWIRRRFGDDETASTAYLPSILSGAGIVTLFGAILGARHLYDLIGQGGALAGLSVVAAAAIVLGWFHGPLLVAIGLVGGAAAPFVVGGGRGSDLRPLHGYFLLLALVGLGVDAVRRWRGRWVSVLALATGLGASTLLVAGAPETAIWHQVAILAVALASVALPITKALPDHSGPMVVEAVRRGARPPIEEALAFVTIAVVAALTVLPSWVAFWPAVGSCVLLVGALSFWARRAWGVQDAALAPAAALIALIVLAPLPEGEATITLVLLAGGAISLLALIRSVEPEATHRLGWTLGAVLAAPTTGLVLHLAADAPGRLGAYPWALHALAVAAGLTFAATAWARRDGDDRLRPSLAALVATTLIAYALGQVVGEAALTASVALMAAGAAWLDRRFRLPLLSWFVVLAAPFTFWRLAAVPGLDWHLDMPLLPVLISLGGAVAGFALATLWLRDAGAERRVEPLAVAETAALGAFGFLLTVLLWRGLMAVDADTPHVATGLTATLWFGLAWGQLVVWARSTRLRWLRLGLAAVFGGLALVSTLAVLTLGNPLFASYGDQLVRGWPVLNTLIPAYLLPALLLLGLWRDLARRLPGSIWTLFPGVLGLGLLAAWVVLTIRHMWQGPEGMEFWNGVSQPEMTTYTVVLILLGAGLFYQGVATRSETWRRAGTGVLALTMLKVFLIDVWSLDGLLRVGALIALAAAMGGLAWLYRWTGGAGPDGAGTDVPGGEGDELSPNDSADNGPDASAREADEAPPAGSDGDAPSGGDDPASEEQRVPPVGDVPDRETPRR
ncbi:DUF2339 domain-containing protein [Jannaschia marina]|uniref:DUF2339 domain-containing protein n=1 Tax=Jannaschia marina TaxID=2741674 RepID=UPI0015CE8987|nr:DUF2339 domain-containing protein [Jannaschia marina]